MQQGGVDADTGRIVAAALTTNDVDDGSQVGPLLDQIDDPIASLTGDGAYDQDGVYGEVAAIPMQRSLCHRGRVACRARRPRMRPLRVTGICKRLPNMAAWVGRKRRGTTGVPWWKPILAAGNGSSVMRCARKPTSVKRPK